jgi:Tol biopolymer transport system component
MRVTNPPPGKYDRFAFWSPDGLWLAFWSTRTGRMETWLVARERIGGSWSQPVQLTNFGCAFSAWVPDGSGTVAQAESDIWVMDLKR